MDHNLESDPNEMTSSAGASFSEFGDNFVSVEGILFSNHLEELLSSGGAEESSCHTSSLTLYKSEPDPSENFENEPERVHVNGVVVEMEEEIPDPVTPISQDARPDNLEEFIPSPTPIFGEEEEDLRPPRPPGRRKRIPKESTVIIPRVFGTTEQRQNTSKTTKSVDYFVRQNMDEYLVRRGFRDPNDQSRNTATLPLTKAAVNKIAYGPQYEAQEIAGEIEKFWKFYNTLKMENAALSNQLKPMLVPVLTHFYDECFLSGETSIALQLYTDFGNQFLQEEHTTENYDILFTISKVSSIQEFEGNELIQHLRRKEYTFKLNNVTFVKLKQFLCSTSCPALVNLFANRLIVTVEESEVQETYEEFPPTGRMEDSWKNFSDPNIESEHLVERLRRSVLTNLPTLSLYTTDDSPICGAVSSQASMLAYGMSNSEIRITFTSKRILNEVNKERKYARRKRHFLSDEGLAADEEEGNHKELTPISTLKGHTGSVCDLVFHPRTRVLFSVSEDTKMKAWDLQEFECKADYRGHTAPIWCIDQTASGHMIVTGSMDSTARIWVPERTDYLRLLAGHYFDVDCVQFHPNEVYVATGSVDKSIRMWSVADGNLVRVLTGMNSSISCIHFHESGKYLIGASEDPVILIWDLAEGEVIAEIPCPPCCRSISLTGNMLSACFSNNTILVWNIYPIVGGGDIYSEEQVYTLMSPKVYKCSDQSSSLVKLFYRDPENLYCLGEAKTSSQSLMETRKSFSRNPLTVGILSNSSQCKWSDADSDSESDIANEEQLAQATQFRYDESNGNYEDGLKFNQNIKEEIYQFST